MAVFDPEEATQHLMSVDRQLERLIPLVGPFTLKPLKGTVFQGLLRSIVHQQLAGKAAQTIHGRVLALLPENAGEQPAALLALNDASLRAAGLSRSKVLSVQDLARRTVGGQIPDRRRLARLADQEVIETLVETRGVGRWTAEMILIFWLGRPDVLPVHDLGVRKGYALTYRKRVLPTPDELERRGRRWQPYRSVAAWYFWRAVDLAARGETASLW